MTQETIARRPRSGLVYRERKVEGTPKGPPLVALGTDLEEIHDFATAVGRARVVSAQGLYGVYEEAMTLKARGWYFEAPDLPSPEPMSFGYGLFEIEQLIYDLHDRLRDDEVPPVLFGHGQGACIALWLARVIPDYLSAVVSLGGVLKGISGYVLPTKGNVALPILMVSSPARRAEVERSAELLRNEGDDVTHLEGRGTRLLDDSTGAMVAKWLEGAVVV